MSDKTIDLRDIKLKRKESLYQNFNENPKIEEPKIEEPIENTVQDSHVIDLHLSPQDCHNPTISKSAPAPTQWNAAHPQP